MAEHAARPGSTPSWARWARRRRTLQRGAGALMDFFMGGKLDQVTLVASPFLESLSEVAVAHLLLEAAVVAEGRLRREEDDLAHEDVEFYRGKVLAAKYFANYVLPQTQARVNAIVAATAARSTCPTGVSPSPLTRRALCTVRRRPAVSISGIPRLCRRSTVEVGPRGACRCVAATSARSARIASWSRLAR